ncbi:MAG: Holliday junction branch migration protein RuvA [Firmicutes bacterium]|nr:Holliday junction branch migration protein RuvA [Bacillota bacterium]
MANDQLLIDVRDVGYLVSIPNSTAAKIVDGASHELFIYTQVRDDAILLYGFATVREKQVFELLISVSGVGPKLALSALSTLAPDALCRGILQGDLNSLTQVPGIGKRTGQRLILELKDKVAKQSWFVETAETAMDFQDEAKAALDALISLGYSPHEARDALAQLDIDNTSEIEDIIRKALGILGKVG